MTKNLRQDRNGKRLLAGHVEEDVHRAFKTLGAKQGVTNLTLMYEALALVLFAHNEPVPEVIRAYLKEKKRPHPAVTFARKSAVTSG